MEMANTRKTLARIPEDKLDWTPDRKSMSPGRLAAHVAEMPGWAVLTLKHDELDFAAGGYVPAVAKSQADALRILDENVKLIFYSLRWKIAVTP